MAANTLKLDGKVAIITGGASGLGEVTARLFASHGAAVVIADINDDLGYVVVASIPPPGRCTFIHCDVREDIQVAAAVNHAISTYGRLDIMFCCAGVLGSPCRILDLDPADLDQLFAVHVRGTALAIKHGGRTMAAAGTRGSIICMGSVAAIQGGFGLVAYTTVKHAVLGLVKAAASELGRLGLRVNCVSPYVVATQLTCQAFGMNAAKVEQMSCAGATLKGPVLRADDVAAVALFLASDDSAFISGHNLVVDGAVTTVNSAFSMLVKEFSDFSDE